MRAGFLEKRNFVTTITALWHQSALFLDHGNSGTPYGIEGQAMRRILSVTVVAAMLIVTAVNVIAAGVKMDARNHYAAPVAGISVALPSGMKSFPVELPE
jgi:hypothetical protein